MKAYVLIVDHILDLTCRKWRTHARTFFCAATSVGGSGAQTKPAAPRERKKIKKIEEEKKLADLLKLHRFLNRFQFIPVFGNSGKGDGVTISGKYQYFSCSDSILCQIARLALATLPPRLDSRKSVRLSFGFFCIISLVFFYRSAFFLCLLFFSKQERAREALIALGQTFN